MMNRRIARISLALVGSLALISSLAFAEVGSKEIKQATRQATKGESALQRGNVDGARASFEKALESVPNFPSACIGLGHIAMREKQYENALKHYESARTGFSENAGAFEAIQTKRYAQSRDQIRSLRDSIQQILTRADASNLLYELQVTKLENAISQLEAIQPPARGADSGPPAEIDFYVGNALFQMGRIDDAVASWETCRAKNQEFAMVHNNLALAYLQQERVADAQVSLSRAKELGFAVNPQLEEDLKHLAAP